MNKNTNFNWVERVAPFAQLFMRVALGIGFFWPVCDRFGILGTAESGSATWGNWNNFVAYAHSLLPFLSATMTNAAAVIATVAEVILGLCLILGFHTRTMAIGSALLTLIFAICMALFISPGAPLNYPVLVFTAASILLSVVPHYKWEIT